MSGSEGDEFAPGTVLAGKYVVERLLGEGGMGVVVAARHELLDDRVAIKFLQPRYAADERAAARFLREARAAVRIKSPYVAQVIDVSELENGSPFMVMEYLEGRDLAEQLAADGPPSPLAAARLTLQVCEALATAHAAGVVHRDIKPGNVFITHSSDARPVAKVLDFGISKVSDDLARSSLTKTQASMGSPLYMSPEQMRSARDVDHRTDIWSVGIVLYETLTGELPFMAASMPQLIALILETEAPRPSEARPGIPEMLDVIVAKCLAPRADDRFDNVADLAESLAVFIGDEARPAAERIRRIIGDGGPGFDVLKATAEATQRMRALAVTTAPPERPRTPPWLVFSAGAVVLAVLIGAVLVLRPQAGVGRAEPSADASSASAAPTTSDLPPDAAPSDDTASPPPSVAPAPSVPAPSASPEPAPAPTTRAPRPRWRPRPAPRPPAPQPAAPPDDPFATRD